ncbi:hypothetical protein DPMN_027349 [Dreissena polymorpha]|uniref:Uncharacterized protein n=1 Tax=Dreissena polymorpha TaxID=45954 RepID=A0A9D4RF56_DREPO|nr:hypothetical protein DPMN_027349 [Dreissena polymorpha]
MTILGRLGGTLTQGSSSISQTPEIVRFSNTGVHQHQRVVPRHIKHRVVRKCSATTSCVTSTVRQRGGQGGPPGSHRRAPLNR